MTRGQETLLMDLGPATRGAGETEVDLSALELVVLAATPDELAAHVQQLAAIDKASKGAMDTPRGRCRHSHRLAGAAEALDDKPQGQMLPPNQGSTSEWQTCLGVPWR